MPISRKSLKVIKSFIFLSTFFFSALSAQDLRRNAVHIELGGSGLLYSFNYERSLPKNFLVKLGFAALYGEHLLSPLAVGKYFGDGTHHLELSLGVTNAFFDVDKGKEDIEYLLLGNLFIGYRMQRIHGRSVFRIGFSPLYTIYSEYEDNKNIFIPSAAISYGYRF